MLFPDWASSVACFQFRLAKAVNEEIKGSKLGIVATIDGTSKGRHRKMPPPSQMTENFFQEPLAILLVWFRKHDSH